MLPTFFTLLSGIAQGCVCPEHAPTCQGYWDATTVFAGVVTRISSVPGETRAGEHEKRTRSELLIRFTVENNYRDSLGSEVWVSTGLGGGDCGFRFRLGERYLVYANRSKETEKLSTSICTLTKLLTEAKEDLEYISRLSTEPPGTRLYGSVLDYTESGMRTAGSQEKLAGVDIRLKGPQGAQELISDKEGKYSWSGLPAGQYQIGATLPNYVSATSGDIEFDLPGRGCFAFDILLQSNGQIFGRVYDAIGNPLPHQRVELADPEGNGLGELRAETDDGGLYHFSGVRSGDFFIGVNISDPPDSQSPYVRTYLPAAQARESAAIVHLPKAGKLTGQDIYLSKRTEPRDVKGVILWPNGKPAPNASISLAYPDYPWRMDSSPAPDSQGNFSIQVLTNLRTMLWVQAPNATGVWMNAGRVELPTEGSIKALTLILNHEPPKWVPPK